MSIERPRTLAQREPQPTIDLGDLSVRPEPEPGPQRLSRDDAARAGDWRP